MIDSKSTGISKIETNNTTIIYDGLLKCSQIPARRYICEYHFISVLAVSTVPDGSMKRICNSVSCFYVEVHLFYLSIVALI